MPENSRIFDFGTMAECYDEWYKTPRGARFDALEKAAVLKLMQTLPRGGKLLEVGAGTGWWSAFFSRNGFAVTGVDAAPEMVAVARGKEIPGACFMTGDAGRLPFGAGEFHVSAALTVLEFVVDPDGVVAEMARCTRRGGALIVGVLNADSSLNRRRGRRADGPWAAARFYSPDQLRRLLKPYGRLTLQAAAFPVSRWLPPAAGMRVEDALQRTGLLRAAFLAARVDLDAPA